MLGILNDKLWIFIILTMFVMYGAISTANTEDSCEASRRTVVRVNKCPENKAEWMEAAKRKNCSAFAESCLEPKRFVYHCVLNPYVNETLEVCAYPRNILLGRCTEYTIRGNLIQESRETCKSFATPCPVTYHSTDAYKYQECYHLIPKVSSSTAITEHMSTVVNEEQPQNNSKFPFRINRSSEDVTMTTEKKSTDRLEKEDNNGIIITITVVCCVVVLVLPLIIVFLMKRFRQHGDTGQVQGEIQLDKRDSKSNESSKMLPNGTESN